MNSTLPATPGPAPRPKRDFRRDPVVRIVAAMVVSLLLVYVYSWLHEGPTPEDQAAARMKGQVAHEFSLQSIDGRTIRLADLHGRAVVLNFWATWCGPCKEEIPSFVELQKQYGPQGLQVVGVDMNDDAGVQDVADFAKSMNMDYPVVVGSKSEQATLASNYGGVPFLPETVFIAPDGKVAEKTIGAKSKSEIEESIRSILPQGLVKQAQAGEEPGKNPDATAGHSRTNAE